MTTATPPRQFSSRSSSTEFFTLGPLPEVGKLALLDQFLKQGLPPEESRAAIWDNNWANLPLDAVSIRELTCKGCGKPPFRSPEGRILLGCPGSCLQKDFVEMKEQSVAARMDRVQKEAARQASFDDNPLLSFMGDVGGSWRDE